jgi:hypothetical protein
MRGTPIETYLWITRERGRGRGKYIASYSSKKSSKDSLD